MSSISATAPAPPSAAAVDLLTPAVNTTTLGTPSLMDSALPPLSAGQPGPAAMADEEATVSTEAEMLEALHELELQRAFSHMNKTATPLADD